MPVCLFPMTKSDCTPDRAYLSHSAFVHQGVESHPWKKKERKTEHSFFLKAQTESSVFRELLCSCFLSFSSRAAGHTSERVDDQTLLCHSQGETPETPNTEKLASVFLQEANSCIWVLHFSTSNQPLVGPADNALPQVVIQLVWQFFLLRTRTQTFDTCLVF